MYLTFNCDLMCNFKGTSNEYTVFKDLDRSVAGVVQT